MFKTIGDQVWAFDCEWVPDPVAGRLLYGIDASVPDAEVLKVMWAEGGATPEDPTPFLKMIQCRVVSIAAVIRKKNREGEIKLDLLWLPRNPGDETSRGEREVVGRFLQGIGKSRPQLVGFNSRNSDIKILTQRAIVHGIPCVEFCRRPDKPWEGVDYFARDNEAHIDLMDVISGWGGKSNASLNEIATLSGIPGKFEAHGEEVWKMWADGAYKKIVEYNCFDALTTYLVWLRFCYFGGKFDAAQYEEEQERVRELLMTLAESPETEFVERYSDEWERLQRLTGQAPL